MKIRPVKILLIASLALNLMLVALILTLVAIYIYTSATRSEMAHMIARAAGYRILEDISAKPIDNMDEKNVIQQCTPETQKEYELCIKNRYTMQACADNHYKVLFFSRIGGKPNSWFQVEPRVIMTRYDLKQKTFDYIYSEN